MSADQLVPLSDAQHAVLKVFRDSRVDSAIRKPKWIAPITRRWLCHRGLILATDAGRGKYDFQITELGLETLRLDEAFKAAIKLKDGDTR